MRAQISDSYKINPVVQDGEEIPGLMESDSTVAAIGVGAVDIGCGNAFGGAGEDEGADDTVEKENNIAGAHAFAYQVGSPHPPVAPLPFVPAAPDDHGCLTAE
jgi:hypothetical protein